MTKKISLKYGNEEITADIPEKNIIFEGDMKYISPISDFEKTLIEKLDNPTGCKRLKEMVSPDHKILILIEDNTRDTPVYKILPVLIGYLTNVDVKLENIEILTAPGTHRIMTEDEIIEKVGNEIYGKIKISQHEFDKKEDLVDLGFVEVGERRIPVNVNKKVQEFDFIIGIGNIVPHSDAGFSGGAKIVQPGICGYSTTAATHIAAALLDEIPLGDVESPCRAGMEKVAKKVGLSFIINTVKNYENEVIDIVVGDFIKAHREGAMISKKSYGVEIPELADIVVVNSFPCDIDYWQALKGLISAYFAVNRGGHIIFATPCTEGLAHNHPKFRDWLKLSYDEARDLAKTLSPDDEKADLISADLAICNSRIREKARISVVTDGLSDEDCDILNYKKVDTLQNAVDAALSENPDSKVGILSLGGICLPIL
ncbi:Nickel-dependent lactate racemase [Dethiosulfatibacter aminovorans DSM 17477]|uniref:Nickel-dependent lactate racemase n=1 Tax=Dethiosulfatibacter aminovorans DSM 17477 TaxID=1121476 RepID=A0A1M6E4M3_9FIRM|nr:nickel-dependent lactate racemase [Dethiosulfatibacter aminovorans]SHI80442.1 Nickel-dependent lactate racemase [Dethiosulfatibacter aminovorans DSM 17477]